jgi:hypothetical protein
MADNATRVADWLKARKGRYFCQRCVNIGISVNPAAQVNQIVRPLANARDYRLLQDDMLGMRRGPDVRGVFRLSEWRHP